jgi:hypothetical protein
MKYYATIKDGIIVSLNENIVDPEESKKAVREKLYNDDKFLKLIKDLNNISNKKRTLRETSRLSKIKKSIYKIVAKESELTFIYMNLPKNSVPIKTDEQFINVKEKFESLEQGKALDSNFNQVTNLKGKTYWTIKDGKYIKGKIEKPFEELPDNAIEQLTKDDLDKIEEQNLTKEQVILKEYNKQFCNFMRRFFEESKSEEYKAYMGFKNGKQ